MANDIYILPRTSNQLVVETANFTLATTQRDYSSFNTMRTGAIAMNEPVILGTTQRTVV